MASELRKAGSNFVDADGKFDTAKFIKANPEVLADVMHRVKDGEEGGTGSFSNQAMAVTTVSAAIKAANGGQSYAPLKAQEAVQALANVAANQLDLTNDLGIAPGSSPSPFPDYGVNPTYAAKRDKDSGNPNEDTENNK